MAASEAGALTTARPIANKYLVAVTVMIGTLIEVIDTSVANVALPHIQGTFSAGQDEVTWVITSYLVANAVILPMTGWIGNYFGRKRAYMWCLALFTLASLLSGAAVSLPMLLAMRVLQGMAGGAMVPMSQAILLESFPPQEHGKAMAMFGVGVIFGPIIGPTLGGWITDTITWRWVFYINVPVGFIGITMAMLNITDPPYMKKPEGRIDYMSFLFLAVGLGALEIFLNRGERYDWFTSPFIQFLALTAALALALFIWRSLTASRPLVDLSVFRDRQFAVGTTLMFLLGFGLYGSFTMLPLFAQTLMHYTATWAGLVLSPGGITSLLSMAVVGALVGRVDLRALVIFGAAMNVWSMWMMMHMNLDVDFQYMMGSRLLQGVGLGFLFVPLTAAAFVNLPPQKIGSATGLFNLMRNEGGSIGIAISSTILAQHAQIHHARLVENLTPGNLVLQEQLQGTAHALNSVSGLDPASNQMVTNGLLGGMVQRQAAAMAYNDVFHMLMISFVVFMPLALLLRGRGKKGVAVH